MNYYLLTFADGSQLGFIGNFPRLALEIMSNRLEMPIVVEHVACPCGCR